MNCLAGGAVPYDRRFALVRDPYSDRQTAADRASMTMAWVTSMVVCQMASGLAFDPSIRSGRSAGTRPIAVPE